MQRRGIDPIHPIHDELVGGKAASCSNAIAGSIGRLSIDRHSSGAVGDHPDLLEENDDDTHKHDLYLDLNPDIDPGQCLGGELGGASLFALVPEELIRHMFQYMDIASLSSLAQTCRAKTFPSPSASYLASDDVLWLSLARRRFCISVAGAATDRRPPRAKSYGGTTWKAAYRSMALANRMPKNRTMPRSNVVLAKGGGGLLKGSNCRRVSFRMQQKPQFHLSRRKGGTGLGNFVSLWAMLTHTDDCSIRRTGCGLATKYVEMRVCLQNIRSGFGSVEVSLNEAYVQIIGTALRTDGLWCSNVVPSGRFRPRIIHRSWNATSRGDSCTDAADGVTLNSFDFVVVSLCIPCAPDMHYETDFLSRCLCLHVPVVWSPHDGRSNGNIKSLASASFLPENQIWNHYMELPGSCLSLINRNNLISV